MDLLWPLLAAFFNQWRNRYLLQGASGIVVRACSKFGRECLGHLGLNAMLPLNEIVVAASTPPHNNSGWTHVFG